MVKLQTAHGWPNITLHGYWGVTDNPPLHRNYFPNVVGALLVGTATPRLPPDCGSAMRVPSSHRGLAAGAWSCRNRESKQTSPGPHGEWRRVNSWRCPETCIDPRQRRGSRFSQGSLLETRCAYAWWRCGARARRGFSPKPRRGQGVVWRALPQQNPREVVLWLSQGLQAKWRWFHRAIKFGLDQLDIEAWAQPISNQLHVSLFGPDNDSTELNSSTSSYH